MHWEHYFVPYCNSRIYQGLPVHLQMSTLLSVVEKIHVLFIYLFFTVASHSDVLWKTKWLGFMRLPSPGKSRGGKPAHSGLGRSRLREKEEEGNLAHSGLWGRRPQDKEVTECQPTEGAVPRKRWRGRTSSLRVRGWLSPGKGRGGRWAHSGLWGHHPQDQEVKECRPTQGQRGTVHRKWSRGKADSLGVMWSFPGNIRALLSVWSEV